MTTLYSVIRYVPDPIAEENLNIGVVAVSGDNVRFRFISNWRRASAFGQKSIAFLREFASEVSEQQLKLFTPEGVWDESKLQEARKRWKNTIQFSDIRPSLKSVDEVVENIAKIYLCEQKPKEQVLLHKRQALRIAWNEFTTALSQRYGGAGKKLLHKYYPVRGKVVEHVFDLAIVNGSPQVAAYTLSFDTPDTLLVRKDIDAAAFAIEDVNRAHRGINTAVIAIASDPDNTACTRAKRIFKSLDTKLILQGQLSRWTATAVRGLPENMKAHG